MLCAYEDNIFKNVKLSSIDLKGLGHDLSSIFTKFILSYLMSKIISMGVFNTLSKLESPISSYKRVTEVKMFCKQSLSLVIVYICVIMICFNLMLLVVVGKIIDEPIEPVYLVSTSYFVKEIVISLLYIICKQI